MNKKSTVAEDIARKLESMILDGVLELGDKLPAERILSARLGVSRPSLREAKQILTYKGLLETTQGGGTYIKRALSSELSDPLLDMLKDNTNSRYDILEVRCSLDSLAAYSAAQRATEEDKDKIKRAFDSLNELHNATHRDSNKEAQADALFHLSIVEASHNIVLLHIMRGLFKVLRMSIANNLDKFYANNEIGEPLHNQHYKLMQAVIDGRADDAREAANEHLKFVDKSMHNLDRENERLNRHKLQSTLLSD